VPQAKKTGGKRAPKGRVRRALVWALPLVVGTWIALSHLVARPLLREHLERTFESDARVAWAIVWPDLDVTGFGVSLEGEHFRADASRVGVGLRAWGLFGSRPVSDIRIVDLRAEIDEGRPLRLFREHVSEGSDAPAELDLDPVRIPPLSFREPEIAMRREDGSRLALFATSRVDVEQTGDRTFRLDTEAGEIVAVPFERLTARLVPRAGHMIFTDLKLRTFNGMVGGVLDVHTARAGAFNGELEWHFVEAETVWRTYGLPYAEKRRGDLSGRVVFRGDRPARAALEGSGRLRLERAAFFSPLSFKVFLTLKVPVAAEARLNDAEMEFSFEKELFFVERARARAREFQLDGQGILSFAGEADLEMQHAGTTVRVSGAIEDPNIKVLPLDGLTVPFDRIFRERVSRR